MHTSPPPSEAAASPFPWRARRGLIIGAAVIAILAAIGLAIFLPKQLKPTTTTPGITSGSTGCPVNAAPPTWPHPATVTLTEHNVDSVTSLKTGDTVEVALGHGDQFRWRLQAADHFQTLTPAGYFDPVRTACVWRFTASSPGPATLSFTRQPVCAPKVACPPIIIDYRFGFAIV